MSQNRCGEWTITILMVLIWLSLLGLVFAIKAQTVRTAALVNQSNTFSAVNLFDAGLSLPGSQSGTILINAPDTSTWITYTLPATAGSSGYALCVGSTVGALAYCPSPGGGAGTPAVNQSPTSLSFGSVTSGTFSTPQTVLVTNTGTAPLSVSLFTFTGSNASEFSETDSCYPALDAGWICSVAVTFKPASTGSKSASLNINDNAAGSPQLVTLSGTGT